MKLQVSKLQNNGQGGWVPLAQVTTSTMSEAVKTFANMAREHDDLIEGKMIDITQHPQFPEFANMQRNTIGAGDHQTLMIAIRRVVE